MTQNQASFYEKHKKTIKFSAISSLFVIALIVGPVFVSAMITASQEKIQAVQARNAAINQAILSGDYNTWRSLIEDEDLKAKVTAANFSQYAEAYRLLQQGKVEEADLIKKQLDLKKQFQEAVSKSQLINEAVANNDYAAWRSIVGSAEPQINEGNFSGYAKAYQLIARGNLKKADTVMKNIGVKNDFYNSSR